MKHIEKLLKKISVLLAVVILFSSASIVKSQASLNKVLDYDGDGKTDFGVFRSTDNTWITGKSSTNQIIIRPFGNSAIDTPAPGDYDGDGKGDIAFWRETDGGFYYVESSTNTFKVKQLGESGDQIVQRDYDGDGKTDFAIVRPVNSYLYWFILQSSNNLLAAYHYGNSTDYPAPGDFDGDGRYDLAVQRKASGNIFFFIDQSSTGATLGVQFGLETDFFAPGDYDGDGKTDIAMVRGLYGETNGQPDEITYKWFIRKSSDGSHYRIDYGSFELRDFIVQGDYDGDGITDIAVWRNTNNDFYVVQSRNGATIGYNFGDPGDLPIASYDTH